jgi:multidrug efflux pump subunit AcrA (membrane-fusion protein)
MPRDKFIIGVWETMGKEVVGASELCLIEEAVVERFGSTISPASIARVLADQGARLGHPEILQADARWREKQLLFNAEDLELTNLDAAIRLINKIEQLWQSENVERLRQAVRRLKTELDSLALSKPLAAEVAQWLTVWLQNPPIFAEWLALRQNTAEFRDRFLS